MLHCLHSSFDQKKWKNSISKPSAITKRDMVQLWRVCAVFFSFAPWSGTAPQAGAQEIWCNCGAFAPYFFPSLPDRGLLPSPAQMRKRAIAAHLRRVFLFFLPL